MEVAMEVEDDLFFADLSKQISLLIMDDDDDEHEHQKSLAYRPSPDSLQAFSQVMYPATGAPYVYEHNSRREISKGTGVFIPLSSQPRRSKNRQSRHYFSSNTNIQGQTQRQQLINQVPPHHYHSLNPTRFS